MKKKKEPEIFVATFWSPSIGQVGYRGPARALSSVNKVGNFDILPGHTNFITLIFDKLSILTPDNKKINYTFKRGVLEVSENLVRVFLGI
jgi:F0F1-type ATP synthase epsilon subunit